MWSSETAGDIGPLPLDIFPKAYASNPGVVLGKSIHSNFLSRYSLSLLSTEPATPGWVA